MRQILFIFIR